MKIKVTPVVPLLFVSLLFWSCKKQEIVYYEIPKEEVTSLDPSSAMPDGHPPVSQSEMGASKMNSLPGFSAPKEQTELKWNAPVSWVDGVTSSVRIASYALDGVSKAEFDFSITRFPGDVGGMFSNVNRWRRQLGLSPLTSSSEVESSSEILSTDHYKFHVFNMENDAQPPLATEVAILQLNGFSWFFKMTGLKENVEAESGHFKEFLISIQPGESQS